MCQWITYSAHQTLHNLFHHLWHKFSITHLSCQSNSWISFSLPILFVQSFCKNSTWSGVSQPQKTPDPARGIEPSSGVATRSWGALHPSFGRRIPRARQPSSAGKASPSPWGRQSCWHSPGKLGHRALWRLPGCGVFFSWVDWYHMRHDMLLSSWGN